MSRKFVGAAIVSRQLAYLAIMVGACVPRIALSQTPSPLQEWQYSGGTVLQKLFEPNLPEWRAVVGAAEELQPLYDGARPYRGEAGP
jgi:hypothetical protein